MMSSTEDNSIAERRLFCVASFKGRGRSGLFKDFPSIPALMLRPKDMVDCLFVVVFTDLGKFFRNWV